MADEQRPPAAADDETVQNVRVPLTDFVTQVAEKAGKKAAEHVVESYQRNCPITVVDKRSKANSDEIRTLRERWAVLVGVGLAIGVSSSIITAVVLAKFG